MENRPHHKTGMILISPGRTARRGWPRARSPPRTAPPLRAVGRQAARAAAQQPRQPQHGVRAPALRDRAPEQLPGAPRLRLYLRRAVRQDQRQVVHGAAISRNFDKLLGVNDEVWNKLFDVNVTANFRLCKMFRPMLKAVRSVFHLEDRFVGNFKVLEDELADDDIRVNAVAPGLIRTRFSSALWKHDNGSDLGCGEREDGSGKESSRLRRSGCVDDVATVAAFLVSKQSRFVSGEIVVVAGATRSRL
ncbi:dehydrogenase/reductase SDR family member 4-like protein [Gracilaria domingensis]|nr:dehydrogenase/reductase SDR family member 4-like protein [Gracilaria domingensis]